MCQRVPSNISFARLIALSNQIKLLLPDIDIVPDITFDQYRLNHWGGGSSIDIPNIRLVLSLWILIHHAILEPRHCHDPRHLFLRSHSSMYVFSFFLFFFKEKYRVAMSFKFLHNWWLKGDWNLNLIYIYFWNDPYGSHCRSFRLKSPKNGVRSSHSTGVRIANLSTHSKQQSIDGTRILECSIWIDPECAPQSIYPSLSPQLSVD